MIDLSKYGITGTTEIVYNPSYELLFEEEMKPELEGYDKEKQSGMLRNLMIRTSFTTKELMIVLYATDAPTNHQAAAADLSKRLTDNFSNLVSLQWIEHAAAVERIQADKIHILHGRDYINDKLNGFNYRIWPDTFFQATPVQAEKLVELAMDMAKVDENMRVLDLFCGVGTFSLPLAKQSKALAGIEIVENSIQSAILNAKDNNIDNTYFMTSDARSGLLKLKEEWGLPDLLLLDPPRSGAGGKVMRSIGRFGTDKIIYVSCSPKSLAEDLVWLRQFNYELVSVQPVDQFPHTTHVETVVLLSQQKPNDRIAVDLDLDELDATSAETKATYVEIKDYVLKEHGLKVSNLNISQVKRKCGIEVGENYNLAKSEDSKQPNCPEEKEKAIVEALKHFGMIG